MLPRGPGPRFAALACLLLAACDSFSPSGDQNGTGGVDASSSRSGTGGGFSIDAGPNEATATCDAGLGGATEERVLAYQAIEFAKPRPKVFYTWTSLKGEQALREGEVLLSVAEDPELGRGAAMELLHAKATEEGASEATASVASVYQKYRYAWPNPWATRMGWPGETYGDRLVRIELRSNAWIAILAATGEILEAYDLDGENVDLNEVAKTPERVGALYFRHAADSCGLGSFTVHGSGGYREFILGSPSMIASFSIGTDAIHDRLGSDILALEDYLGELRAHGAGFTSTGAFDEDVYCEWGTTCDPYLLSLALGSEYYRPIPANILAILDALNAFDWGAEPYQRNGN